MSEKPPGFEEYTPSRLEWLVVILNSYVHYTYDKLKMNYGIECLFIPNGDGKTLILKIRYFADASLELVEDFSENVKTFALQIARGHKWDSWLKIHTKFEPIDRPSEN